MSLPAIPSGIGLRVVGDVHGDAASFAYATATDRFVVQLGDLVDHGPRSDLVLERMFEMIGAGRGLFLLGNHDHRLARALAGQLPHIEGEIARTLGQLDPALAARARQELERAPLWLRQGGRIFVHAGFHTAMAEAAPEALGARRPSGMAARALFGEPTGRTQPDGYPERSLRWIDRIPPELTVYCGHDQRSTDGRPWRKRGTAGGEAVLLDTGAGKGGHLSWIDLPAG